MGILRFLLAASVVFAHSYPGEGYLQGLADPLLAVESFFIISGFYIAMVYNEHYSHFPHPKKYFYKSRYLRLYPSYFICTLLMLASLIVRNEPYETNGGVTVFVSSWSEIQYLFQHMPLITKFYQIFSNFTLFGYDLANFIDINTSTGETSWTAVRHVDERFLRRMINPPAWSIGIELSFYILAPWLVRFPVKTLLPIVASSFLYKFALYKYGMFSFPLSCGFFPAEIGIFGMGALLYRFYKKYQSDFDKTPWFIYVPMLSGVIIFGYEYSEILLQPEIKYTIFLLCLTASLPIIFGFSRRLKWDRLIGELSYPIYIGHSLVDYYTDGMGQHRGVYTLCFTIVLAIMLLLLVERPIGKFRRRPL